MFHFVLKNISFKDLFCTEFIESADRELFAHVALPGMVVPVPGNFLPLDCQSPASDDKKNTVREPIPGKYPADRPSSSHWLTGRGKSAPVSHTARLLHSPAGTDLENSTVEMKSRLATFFIFFATKMWSNLKINVLRQQ